MELGFAPTMPRSIPFAPKLLRHHFGRICEDWVQPVYQNHEFCFSPHTPPSHKIKPKYQNHGTWLCTNHFKINSFFSQSSPTSLSRHLWGLSPASFAKQWLSFFTPHTTMSQKLANTPNLAKSKPNQYQFFILFWMHLPFIPITCDETPSRIVPTTHLYYMNLWQFPSTCLDFVKCDDKIRDKIFVWEGKGEGRIKATRVESQWIVAARPLCHLQYAVAYLSRLQRILPTAWWELRFKASRKSDWPYEVHQRHVPLGAKGPYCWSANKRRAQASLLAWILT